MTNLKNLPQKVKDKFQELSHLRALSTDLACHFVTDWEETEEDTEDAHFWEDNWDDDDVEDDFSKQLRLVADCSL